MSDDLKLNKILGAGLATVFAILIVKEVSTRVYAEHPAEKAGYAIAIPEVAEGGGAAAVLPVDWGTVLPTADAAKGGTAFARCAACHTVTQGGANGIGPNLFGVVGRRPASHAGFAYSEAMTQHAGEAPAWTYDELDAFIRAPNRHVPGTKMSFAGLKDTDTRVALIAYLRSQGSGGYAIPAPDPARQPGAAAPAEGAVPAPVAGAPVTEGATQATADAGGPAGQTPQTGPAARPTTSTTRENDSDN